MSNPSTERPEIIHEKLNADDPERVFCSGCGDPIAEPHTWKECHASLKALWERDLEVYSSRERCLSDAQGVKCGQCLACVRERLAEARAALAKAEAEAAALHDRATWYAYDPETGYDTFGTAAEAQRAAEESIDEYREGSGDGWHEGVEHIEWGLAIPFGTVAQTNVVDTPDSPMGFDFTCDYDLKSNDGASAAVLARLRAADEKAATEPARIAAAVETAREGRNVAWLHAVAIARAHGESFQTVVAYALATEVDRVAPLIKAAVGTDAETIAALRAAKGE